MIGVEDEAQEEQWILRIEMCNPLRLKDSLRFAGRGKGWCLFCWRGQDKTRKADFGFRPESLGPIGVRRTGDSP